MLKLYRILIVIAQNYKKIRLNPFSQQDKWKFKCFSKIVYLGYMEKYCFEIIFSAKSLKVSKDYTLPST